MGNPQLADSSDALALVKRGDPNAIAGLLNQVLNPRGIFARVGSHGNCLGILLESAPVPDQDEMVTAIRQLFDDLKPESIKFVKVGGYRPGQNLPAWYEEIELEGALTLAESSYRAASVESWLNQGLEPIGGYAANHQLSGLPQPLGQRSPFNSAQSLNGTRSETERRFLRFYINDRETALLPLSSIQQVRKVPVMEILPVPHMPDCVLGIYNWQGEMLWLVDLAQQLGFASSLTDFRSLETVSTIAIQTNHTCLGMVVPQTIDIETHNLQQLQPPTVGLFSAKLLSCMQGYFVASSSPVLNAKALAQDPLLQVHYPR
ncbi:chemotaxis protein CheW [Leptolyngbya sp. FACHB-36]|uniref:chemotaxis protein CheW n=1 Tax=Leptolyngbya sp. FACHB-36 TaxID=2692808 RepID=UPI001681A63D|nr:chemotaxis protein CheW [Leptolyngbya sp. FACHB-36]